MEVAVRAGSETVASREQATGLALAPPLVGPAAGSDPAPGTAPAGLLAPEVAPTHPTRGVRDAVVPLTSDLRRLSVTVSAGFLEKLAAARDGLSHTLPGATTEQVLEAALDRLLEHQARRRGQVKRPRQRANLSPSAAATAEAQAPATTDARRIPAEVRPPADARRIPAEVRREVWARDQGRCQHPLDGGGICGSTVRLELDHMLPVALGGPPVATNLRLACSSHNRAAAWEVLGGAVMASARNRRRTR